MNKTCSTPTATACAKWRYDNLLCGKSYCTHDEYWDNINGEEYPAPLMITIAIEAKNRKSDYWKRGLKRAASQFVITPN